MAAALLSSASDPVIEEFFASLVKTSSIDPSKAFIGSQASRGSWSTSPTRRHNGAIGRGCAETPTRHLKFFHPEEAFVCPLSCPDRSEEHTSELQSLMRISYAVFCLKKKTKTS